MENIIIEASIELLQSEGLKFSIDMLAKKFLKRQYINIL